jgi:hypothetical protein
MNEKAYTAPPYRLALSIVSHGQGSLVASLLQDLAPHVSALVQVLVTINIPESEAFLDRATYPVTVIRNATPLGFGANHNQAFAQAGAAYFVVMNPDIRLTRLDFDMLLASFEGSTMAAVSPLVRGVEGGIEDHARRFPSLLRISHRVVRRFVGLTNAPDYDLMAAPLTVVEWVAGMFIVFRSDLYRCVGGFDERYFMYLEDADICRRLAAAGWFTAVNNRVEVVHAARRSTLRQWRHFRWHVSSLARFFIYTAWSRARRSIRGGTAAIAK